MSLNIRSKFSVLGKGATNDLQGTWLKKYHRKHKFSKKRKDTKVTRRDETEFAKLTKLIKTKTFEISVNLP